MIHIEIKGSVQGVGFRSTARTLATKLGLVGLIRNLPNGNVEIILEGGNYQAMIEELKKIFHFNEVVRDITRFEVL